MHSYVLQKNDGPEIVQVASPKELSIKLKNIGKK